MKKILFATTALVATAGVAAADVTFGGYARYGLGYLEDAVNDTYVTSRFRLQIDATAESDAGVQFGARVRIQQDNDDLADEQLNTAIDTDGDGELDTVVPVLTPGSAPSGFYNTREGTGINGVRYFVRAGGLEVGVGNIFGALEVMPGQYPIDLGLTGLSYDYVPYDDRGDAYSSDDNGAAGHNGVEFIYTFGDFMVHASASDVNDRRVIVGAYTWSGWTFALGLQDSDSALDTEWTATIGGDIGPVFVNLGYAENGSPSDVGCSATTCGDVWVLAGRFDVGASTNIEAYVADGDYYADEAYGIDFNHDLGGGTSLRGGIENTNDGLTQADLGVRFDF